MTSKLYEAKKCKVVSAIERRGENGTRLCCFVVAATEETVSQKAKHRIITGSIGIDPKGLKTNVQIHKVNTNICQL